MQITGMLHGARLLQFVGFPASEILGPSASEEEIKTMIDRHRQIFIKPVFKGGVGKKGKAGLIGRATDLATALQEKERLYFAAGGLGRLGKQDAQARRERLFSAVAAAGDAAWRAGARDARRCALSALRHY